VRGCLTLSTKNGAIAVAVVVDQLMLGVYMDTPTIYPSPVTPKKQHKTMSYEGMAGVTASRMR
jgi:hypothetical protein